TVSLTFPAGSGLKVTVLDGQDKTTQISDYRWIIEEDRTFAINPTTQTNTGTTVVPTFGTNFHTSYMPVVAQGCVGTVACESGQTNVTVLVEPTPLETAKISVFVFEDDNPLNGENDAGGGVDVLAPNEPGLGGFEITLFDDAGGSGDATGQMTYDMFNMPLSNSLAGTPDPANNNIDACPISKQATANAAQKGITGMILTCPKYEADGKTQ